MCRSAPRRHLFPKHYCCFLLEVFVCGEAQTLVLYVFWFLLLGELFCILGSKHDREKLFKAKCIYDETRSYEKFQLVANMLGQKMAFTFCHYSLQSSNLTSSDQHNLGVPDLFIFLNFSDRLSSFFNTPKLSDFVKLAKLYQTF